MTAHRDTVKLAATSPNEAMPVSAHLQRALCQEVHGIPHVTLPHHNIARCVVLQLQCRDNTCDELGVLASAGMHKHMLVSNTCVTVSTVQ